MKIKIYLKTRILSHHNTREEAFTRKEIQIKYNLINNIKYMNMCIARKNGYFGGSGEKCASYNRVCVYDKNGETGLGTNTYVDSAGNIRVLKMFWKSRRKIKKVKSYDMVSGEEVYTISRNLST